MLNRIGNFIMYHNGFTILLWVVLVSGGTALAANPDVREAVGSSVIQSSDQVTRIDNSLIINTDIEQFDFELQVTEVREDEYTYYVDYTYRTLEVRDGAWQIVYKQDSVMIFKPELGGLDFEAYAQLQLAEFIEGQRRLLAETQNIERTLGQSGMVMKRTYTGLIGRFLDTKEIVSEQIAVEPPVVVVVPDPDQNATSTNGIGNNPATSTATTTPDTTATSTSTSTPVIDDGEDDPADEEPVDSPPDQADPEPAPVDEGADGGGEGVAPEGGDIENPAPAAE